MQVHVADPPPLKVASVADDGTEELEVAGEAPPVDAQAVRQAAELAAQRADEQLKDAQLDELCEHLAWWVHTRRLFGAPRGPVSLLGKLRGGARPLRKPGGPDAALRADLAALYIALIAQPADALDRRVFELHYLHRVANVKVAAAQLEIGRQYWYRLLKAFRRRIHAASREILATNEANARAITADRGPPSS